jgi:hypothetical protein
MVDVQQIAAWSRASAEGGGGGGDTVRGWSDATKRGHSTRWQLDSTLWRGLLSLQHCGMEWQPDGSQQLNI